MQFIFMFYLKRKIMGGIQRPATRNWLPDETISLLSILHTVQWVLPKPLQRIVWGGGGESPVAPLLMEGFH